ncbi:hypothetical protein BN14_12151 [Rhizoctonia solani AG-1 IB]|uniref:Uncharacterized protein n=1 Tax=Thanatephorus cucumeris (strain AG1-IB / isolate 7/3/14) TaxID=1108050 RepID=M5CFB6_THACB|nr:hypothetical protein BN14_12151 [Rhizoctonia solani AG-1 IB]
MYWLDPKGVEGSQSLYGFCVYRWWHFLASMPIAFQDFAQWHCQGFLTLPPVISAALSAAELGATVANFVLLYPANSSTVPVSSPASAHVLSDSEESLATPPCRSNSPAITSILRQFSPSSRPVASTYPCNR